MSTKKLKVLSKFIRSSSTKAFPQFATTGTDISPPQYEGFSYDKILDIRKNNINPAVRVYYKKPVLVHSGQMQWLFDHEGKHYLDLFGGIVTVSVGHCHPRVNQALEEQIKKLWHTTNIYLHPKLHEYTERLLETMPPGLDSVYFVNSGSEANDLAILMSRLYTGNFDIISFRNAYHGASPYTMGLTAHSTWRFPVPSIANGIIHATCPDPYAGEWGGKACRDSPIQSNRSCDCGPNDCKAGKKYIEQLDEIFKYSVPKGKMAGMFAESIQGVGGTVQYPKNYVKEAAKLVRENGGLFIADEVQTGFGRTGDHFWGFEGHGITPDIVTMAKGIGNGFPLAAIVTRKEIGEVMTKALHFNTFGGNPMACAVGISVLDVIKDEKLQENSLEVGTYFLNSLSKLRDEFEVVGDVRGKGLMIGVELVNNKLDRKPLDAQQVAELWEETKDLGVLIGKGGLHGNVLRIKPPMCINKINVDMAVEVLRTALTSHKKKYL